MTKKRFAIYVKEAVICMGDNLISDCGFRIWDLKEAVELYFEAIFNN